MAGEAMIRPRACVSCVHNTSKGCAHEAGSKECLGGATPYKLWESARVALPENSGAHAAYYELTIQRPKSGGAAYKVECQDIIEALQMDFNEGNVFKGIWRRCAARTLGKVKKGNEDTLYDAQKVEFYSNRILEQEENK